MKVLINIDKVLYERMRSKWYVPTKGDIMELMDTIKYGHPQREDHKPVSHCPSEEESMEVHNADSLPV